MEIRLTPGVCGLQDALLATINTKDEHDFLHRLTQSLTHLRQSTPAWVVGMVAPDFTHSYLSLDGSLGSYISWAKSQPDNVGHNYIRMRYDGLMADAWGGSEKYFICEKHPGNVPKM